MSTTNKTLNKSPYLRTSRDFPDDTQILPRELEKAYIEIANNINVRTIGIFPTNVSVVTGEAWYFDKNKKQQTLRQAFFFTSTAPIPHNLDFRRISAFSRCFGEYTDGINWYGIIHANSNPIPNQTTFYIDPTNVIIIPGGPPLTKGNIVLEWISDV
jgi:hypothetical protein